MRRFWSLADLRDAARKHGGKCLSKSYLGLPVAHEWQCAEGHRFEMLAIAVVKKGAWCRICSGQRPHTIESIRAFAKKRGGECVSREFVNVSTKLRWRCAKGHEWEAIPDSVLRGTWCAACHGRMSPPEMLRRMRAAAREKGGRCLATEYVQAKHPYEWRCTKGHLWTASWDDIHSGKWCPKCQGRLSPDEAIEQLQELAADRGGECLSRRYLGTNHKLRWRCKEGHTWLAPPSSIRSGRWCHRCAHNIPLSLAEARKLARARGGECLAKTMKSGREPVRWRCENRHTWTAPASRIKNSSAWCLRCARMPRYTLEDMQALAQERGGQCVSKRFVTVNHHLTWRCDKGHRWRATGGQLMNSGTWCPVCWGRRKGTITQMRALAKERGGKCLSPTYKSSTAVLRWRCAEGHEFSKAPVGVSRGQWCPFCSRRGANVGGFILSEHKRLAQERGGQCLSPGYELAGKPLRWRCQQGHEFSMSSATVTGGGWCPECAHTRRPKLDEFRALAKARGGECVSERYVNSTQPLTFVCAKGHRWSTRPANLRKGSWCPKCARARRAPSAPLGLEDLQLMAAERGGECLAQEYITLQEYVRWRCGIGHEWEAKGSSIRKGSWCPHCSGRAPLTLETMKQIAETRGGECLSNRYAGVRVKLRWRCAMGHEWRTTPALLRKGSWCPRCVESHPDEGIARVSALARKHGGLCLSASHPYKDKPLRWQCARGHTWRAVEATVRSGKWCPRCGQ